MKQRTILREASISGTALHTAAEVTLTLKPAPVNTGIVFKRKDIFGKPEVKPHIEMISAALVRNTGITSGHTKLHTIEHVLAALTGMGIDNCIVEMDAAEPPILDGSAKFFVNLIQQAEPVEQDADRVYFELKEPVSVTEGNRSLIALPYDGLKITCTSADDRGIHTQHLSLDIPAADAWYVHLLTGDLQLALQLGSTLPSLPLLCFQRGRRSARLHRHSWRRVLNSNLLF